MDAADGLTGGIEPGDHRLGVAVDVDAAVLVVQGREDQHRLLGDIDAVALELDELGGQVPFSPCPGRAVPRSSANQATGRRGRWGS
jgi:hypothetical protein